jgi:hypothetical protein
MQQQAQTTADMTGMTHQECWYEKNTLGHMQRHTYQI